MYMYVPNPITCMYIRTCTCAGEFDTCVHMCSVVNIQMCQCVVNLL